MKKVGILTINDYSNYGNRLQNYAVQEVLEDLGYEVETIVNTTIIDQKKNSIGTSVFRRIKIVVTSGGYKKLKNKIYYKLNEMEIQKAKARKIENFKHFSSKFIKETDYSISKEVIPKELKNKFDYFITGSDQVWNPNFRRFSEIDFLTFAPKEKRIAFSPSLWCI